jgi:hypothetical protein
MVGGAPVPQRGGTVEVELVEGQAGPHSGAAGLEGVRRRLTSNSLCSDVISMLTDFLAGSETENKEKPARLLACVVVEMLTFPEKGIRREYRPQASVLVQGAGPLWAKSRPLATTIAP